MRSLHALLATAAVCALMAGCGQVPTSSVVAPATDLASPGAATQAESGTSTGYRVQQYGYGGHGGYGYGGHGGYGYGGHGGYGYGGHGGYGHHGGYGYYGGHHRGRYGHHRRHGHY